MYRLTVEGECPPEGEVALIARLVEILPEYGATASQFHGVTANGPVLSQPAEPQRGRRHATSDAWVWDGSYHD